MDCFVADTPRNDGRGAASTPQLRIFEGAAPALVRCLPGLVFSRVNPEDCAVRPHEITHITDALRYGVMSRRYAEDFGMAEEADAFAAWRVKEVDEYAGFIGFN